MDDELAATDTWQIEAKPGVLLAPAKLMDRARCVRVNYTYSFRLELTVDLKFDDFGSCAPQ
ncbi:hypothetical protein [Massilia sp. BSC265]|uniref:hypothetical protein n=1 Tax=Massilia sp. BSC265 TaxID=1549812 RepID=UPI00126A515D|nr:hypothetical protein [Massilia sp. BSC265]